MNGRLFLTLHQLVSSGTEICAVLATQPHDDNDGDGGDDVISHCLKTFINKSACWCQILLLCRPSAAFLF